MCWAPLKANISFIFATMATSLSRSAPPQAPTISPWGTQQVTVGAGIPIHRHLKMDEAFYVLEGSGIFILNDVRHPFEKGGTIFIPMTDLKAPEVEDWLAGLKWQVRRSKQRPKEPDKFLPLAPGTKKKIRDVMHLLYEHAKRYGWWPEDRINPISKVRQGGERQTTPIRLNLEELHLLIYEVLKQRERTMVLFDFAGGLRRGELTGSKWGDIDFVQKIFKPERSVVKMRIGKLKTKGSADPVPLDASVIEELVKWRSETPYAADDDFVFASPKMKGKQPYWMSRIMQHFIRPTAASAGIMIKGWHTLRHSYTTLLRQNENDPKVVQGLLRWASPKMMNMYDEAVAPEKRTAHEELLQNLSRRTANVPQAKPIL
jgi:integrase